MRILLVEPDGAAAHALAAILRKEGVAVDTAAEGEAAFAHAELLTYQAIVTELALPDMTGLSLLRSLRAVRNATPVLFLSACGDVEMRVKALSNGADDYLTKPVHADELLARLHAAVRRAAGRPTSLLTVGDLSLDLFEKTVDVAGERLRLTGKEYSVLELLALRSGQAVEKRFFLDHIYGGRDEPADKIIDVFVCKLRNKIRQAGGHTKIDTIWGRGFALRERTAA